MRRPRLSSQLRPPSTTTLAKGLASGRCTAPFLSRRAPTPTLESLARQFITMYEANCIRFDRIFAWDAQRFEPAPWWKPLPVAVRAKLTFMNVGVLKEPTRSDGSVLRLLNETATERDFVAVKVDIGTPRTPPRRLGHLPLDRSSLERCGLASPHRVPCLSIFPL